MVFATVVAGGGGAIRVRLGRGLLAFAFRPSACHVGASHVASEVCRASSALARRRRLLRTQQSSLWTTGTAFHRWLIGVRLPSPSRRTRACAPGEQTLTASTSHPASFVCAIFH